MKKKKNKYTRVGDKYRTHPWSLIKGGVIICTRIGNGLILEYDKIKDPTKYMAAIKRKNPLVKVWWYKEEPNVTYDI